jgi:hypothetical protein
VPFSTFVLSFCSTIGAVGVCFFLVLNKSSSSLSRSGFGIFFTTVGGGGRTGAVVGGGTGDDVTLLVELGKAKRSSFSSVEIAVAVRDFGVLGVRFLFDALTRSLNNQIVL